MEQLTQVNGSEYAYVHARIVSTWCKELNGVRLRGRCMRMREWQAHGARSALAANKITLLSRREQQSSSPSRREQRSAKQS